MRLKTRAGPPFGTLRPPGRVERDLGRAGMIAGPARHLMRSERSGASALLHALGVQRSFSTSVSFVPDAKIDSTLRSKTRLDAGTSTSKDRQF